MLGGMAWPSTAEYYRMVNEHIMEVTGGQNGPHTAKIILYSVDFHDVEQIRTSSDWEEWGRKMAEYAKVLEGAGADFIIICTNTMHRLADVVEEAIDIPIMHIGDATAEAIKREGLRDVGLLGTKITMTEDFLKKRFERHGIRTIVPEEGDMDVVDETIRKELVRNVIKEQSKLKLVDIIEKLAGKGAEGVVLACTELPLLVSQEDIDVPLFDTTRIHAVAAAEFALRP